MSRSRVRGIALVETPQSILATLEGTSATCSCTGGGVKGGEFER